MSRYFIKVLVRDQMGLVYLKKYSFLLTRLY